MIYVEIFNKELSRTKHKKHITSVQMEQRQLQQLEKHQQLLLKWLRALPLFRCGQGKLQDPR